MNTYIKIDEHGNMLFTENKQEGINSLIDNKQENRNLFIEKNKCDKIDYLISIVCGVIGGAIDVFLVGAPGNSKLGKWTDKQIDNVVMKFSKLNGWNPQEQNKNNVKSAIEYLEKKFKVNYDQSVSNSASAIGLTPNNHHMKSLAHSPDIIGLFFSILNQFTSTSTFLSDGRLITMDTYNQSLQGHNFISKLFCGVYNWIGHLMSDFAGSSSSKGRGKGLVMPFYELFNLCNFGKFNINDKKGTMADVAIKAFENGYDARFGITVAIPVVMTNLLIKLIWSLRRLIQFKAPIRECIPTSKHSDLRLMLLIGNGTLCFVDAMDATIRSGGNFLEFIMRLNMVAWFKLVKLIIKEVLIRVGISSFDREIEAIRIAAYAITDYLLQLKELDLEAYEKETLRYSEWNKQLEGINDENTLNIFLKGTYEYFDISKPWKGDFDTFMSNRNNHLVYR